MKGYHYTSWRNWQSIKNEGFKPHLIEKTELLEYFDAYPRGIWIWERPMPPEDELGTIIHQLSTKASLKIVKLEVDYERDYCLQYDERLVRLIHDGIIDKWIYHRSQPGALIFTRPIKPKNIKLLKVYNLLDII